MLDDGRTLDVSTIVWCTGFDPDHSWIDLPVRDDAGALTHDRGVTSEPGLYFLGLVFQHALASSMINGVGADAAFVADHLADRVANESDGGGVGVAASVRV